MGGTNKDAVSLDYSSLNGSGDATINGSMEEKHGTPSAEEVSLHNLWAQYKRKKFVDYRPMNIFLCHKVDRSYSFTLICHSL